MKEMKFEKIYTKFYDGMEADVHFSDLPEDIKEDDIIDIRRSDSFYSDNESYEAYTKLVIIRGRLETDEEYQKRMIENQKSKEESKNRRYQNYLRLKEEFGEK